MAMESRYVDPVGDGRYQTIVRWSEKLRAYRIIDYVGNTCIGDVLMTKDCVKALFGEEALKHLEEAK